jgi:hypothetical protein
LVVLCSQFLCFTFYTHTKYKLDHSLIIIKTTYTNPKRLKQNKPKALKP